MITPVSTLTSPLLPAEADPPPVENPAPPNPTLTLTAEKVDSPTASAAPFGIETVINFA